ncbi:MAG: hypothetical protein LBS00_02250 [Synergistaceae bacterium]|jgi:hypothetical protein|nr:hypothetical protein [Synergistaceae bacterium]
MRPNGGNKKRRRSRGDDWGFLKKTIYYAVIVFLIAGVAEVYLLWLDNYNMLHPDVAAAMAMGYAEELPLNGILLWDERVVPAPREGVVTYLSPLPRRVAKGEAVAAINGVAVKSDAPGYFSPALDGQEGEWVYSKLWPGVSQFPNPRVSELVPQNSYLQKGDPVGKLVPQPQDLRCIAYLDSSVSLKQDIERGFIEIKTERNGKTRQAAVRASLDVGQKVKVYITLPFFPPDVLMTRAFSCSVLTGNRQGVSVPDSAVVLREGKLGVLMVRGSVAEFAEIEGFPADENNFFITKGAVPGNVVVLQADKVKEGVVRPW